MNGFFEKCNCEAEENVADGKLYECKNSLKFNFAGHSDAKKKYEAWVLVQPLTRSNSTYTRSNALLIL